MSFDKPAMSRRKRWIVTVRSGLFAVKLDVVRGVVVLTSSQGNIVVIGGSGKYSCLPGEKVTSVTIVPPQLGRDVIAVAIHDRGTYKGGEEWRAYLFEVSIRDGKPWVEITSEFACHVEKIGQAYFEGFGFVDVVVGDGRRYTSRPSNTRPGLAGIYVSDANLLCRFLVDQASEEEVAAAAQKHEAELTELERLQNDVGYFKQAVITSAGKLRNMTERAEEMEARLRFTHRLLDSAMRFIGKVRGTVDTCLFPKRKIDRLLRNYYPLVTAPTDESDGAVK